MSCRNEVVANDQEPNAQFVDGREFQLPKGWVVEIRARTNLKYQGKVDQFYYEPHTQKQFRSLKAVKEFLRRDAPQSEQLHAPEESQAGNHAQSSSSNFNLSSTTTEKKRKILTFNLSMPPQNLTWVLTDVESHEWSPYVHDEKIPDAVKNHWAQIFASIIGGNV
ncbi:hypothetical protein M0R45_031278 [Rubus argutus]|uniref:MBD domain-containing protein n=1 Tax=Rubus argutus TaxID=59490 RepID=A0AAW1WFZ2_RUBAR